MAQDETSEQYTDLTNQLYLKASNGSISSASYILSQCVNDTKTRQELLLPRASQQGSAPAALDYAEEYYHNPNTPWENLASFHQQTARLPLVRLRLAIHELYQPQPEPVAKALATMRALGQAAEPRTHQIALQHLGQLYILSYDLIGLTPNRQHAQQYFDRLAELSPPQAALECAYLAQHFGDIAVARRHWQESATPWVFYTLAQHAEDIAQKSAWYQQVAVGSVARAYTQVAAGFSAANQQNYRLAVQRACTQQFASGTRWTILDQAVGAKKGITSNANLTHAEAWSLLAGGIPEAFSALGRLRFTTNNDDPKAESCLRQAISLGQVTAGMTLGRLLEKKGSDYALEARALWQQAAQTRDQDGTLYLEHGHMIVASATQRTVPKPSPCIARYSMPNTRRRALTLLECTSLDAVRTKTSLRVSPSLRWWAIVVIRARGCSLERFSLPATSKTVYDLAKAAGFLLLAEHSNYAEAWYLLGQLYDENYALPIDLTPAYDYYQKAAYLGQSNAQYRLGLGYRYGYGPLEAVLLTGRSCLARTCGATGRYSRLYEAR
ncbi:MAG: sel1 repeat family protein [Alphaproteobacteria bacterium]|nr:sel1 repeat family protein [Alphaproteobacteria bacterium]